jgi:multidrug resistance efflux pump
MSTASDVANTERWLKDAQEALAGAEAGIEHLKAHVSAAEEALPDLQEAVAKARVAYDTAKAELQDTQVQAGVAEAEGSVG